MKLSMSLLEKYLTRYTPKCDLRNDRMNIRGVRFLSDQRLSLSPEYVYLGRADNYFSDEKYTGACLIVNGKSRMICFDCDYEELLNDLISAFDYHNDWEQQLRELAARHASAQEIMDVAAALLDTPASLVDMDGNILGMCHTEGFPDDPMFSYMVENRIMPVFSMSRRFQDAQGKVVQDLPDSPQRIYTETGNEGAVTMYLRQDEEKVAFFQIYEFARIENHLHLQLQEFLAPYFLQCEEIAGSSSAIRSNGSILLRLVKGESVPESALEKFKASTGITPPWQLLEFRNLTIQSYTHRRLLVRGLNGTDKPCYAQEMDNSVLVLFEAQEKNAVLREVLSRVNLKNVVIGISMPVMSVENLSTAYRQCTFVLSYSHGSGIHECQDYALEYLMENVRNQPMVNELLHPAIGVLEQYDKENNSQLLQTLVVYMLEDRNQNEAANRLYIHRNTMKYRLDRIDQLTGIDYTSWEERYYLNMSLLLSGTTEEMANL